MWQYQKLSMLLALGLVAISTSTGCATTVEDPVDDEQAMSAEDAAETSEALTTGNDFGPGYGGFYGYRRGRGLALGHALHGGLDHFHGGYGYGGLIGGYGDLYDGYGYGGYGYGGYGYGGYGGYGALGGGDVNVIVNQNNGGYGGDYGGYLPPPPPVVPVPLPVYTGCGGGYGDYGYDDGWN